MNLPQKEEHRFKLNGYLDQDLQLNTEIEILKEDRKNIREMAKDELDVNATDFNNLSKARIDAKKLSAEIDVRETALAENEILANIKLDK